MIVEKRFADGGFVYTFGNSDGVELPELMAGLGTDGEAEVLEAFDEKFVILLMALPTVFQAFNEHEAERFVQGVIHRDGRGVMIDAFLAPVTREEIHIEIPALNFLAAFGGDFHRAWAERNGREAGRCAETFLRAAVNGVDLPIIEPDGASAKGRDGIEEEKRAGVVSEFRNFFDRRERAGGRFGVDDGDEFRALAFEGVGDLLRFDDAAPGSFDFRDFRAAAFRHIDHAGAEDAVNADDHFVAGFDEIYKTEFHPRAAGAADRESHFVFREEDGAEHRFDLVHHFHENGIEMSEKRHGHGLEDGGRDVAGAGTHEEASGRTELSRRLHKVRGRR